MNKKLCVGDLHKIKNCYKKQNGFTIVELLVVIVVIAILAAVTIVSYNGISKRAIEASMQSDLQSAAQLVETENTQNGSYPLVAAALNNGNGLPQSSNSQVSYIRVGSGFCLWATNSKTSSVYRIDNKSMQVLAGNCSMTNNGVVTTFAGSTWGYVDGTGGAAQFSAPTGVAIDSSNNVFIADNNNHLIRKITPAGVVTTFAGQTTRGYTDGTGTAAQFYYPSGIAIDTSGNLYVTEPNHNMVRKITPAGVVTTLAGSLTSGATDGTGTAARFNGPDGIDVDTSGNVYVADTNNNCIRKITSAGVVTTFAGSTTTGNLDGTGTAAQFRAPIGIAVDISGNVYVADASNYRIRKITSAGVVTTFAGSTQGTADGTGTAAQFTQLRGLTVDPTGTIYATDGSRIRKITSTGVVTTAGYAEGTGTAAQFDWPYEVASDGSGVLYVAEANNTRIRKVQ